MIPRWNLPVSQWYWFRLLLSHCLWSFLAGNVEKQSPQNTQASTTFSWYRMVGTSGGCQQPSDHWNSWLVPNSEIIRSSKNSLKRKIVLQFLLACNDWCLEMSRCLGILASTICSSICTCKIKVTSSKTMWSCGLTCFQSTMCPLDQ